MKKDTENLDILLLLKSQQLHRVAPFSVPSHLACIFYDVLLQLCEFVKTKLDELSYLRLIVWV